MVAAAPPTAPNCVAVLAGAPRRPAARRLAPPAFPIRRGKHARCLLEARND